MSLVLALIAFALVLGLSVKRVGLGVFVAVGFFTCLASAVYLFAYFRL